MPSYSLHVNGTTRSVSTAATTPLLSVLRDHLHLTGTKYGCGEGQCGACMVLVDNKAVPSCLLPVSAVRSKPVTTIEGLAQGDRLSPVQEAFLRTGAFQCGFCTPGIIVAATALLLRQDKPGLAEIRAGLDANLCRCGTYPRIIQAVQLAARLRAEAPRG